MVVACHRLSVGAAFKKGCLKNKILGSNGLIVDEASNMMALRSRGVTTLLIVVTLSTCIADPQQDIDDKDYFDR